MKLTTVWLSCQTGTTKLTNIYTSKSVVQAVVTNMMMIYELMTTQYHHHIMQLLSIMQDDYIKWKGSLFYQFVSTLVDDHLSKLTEFCLVQLLLARQPNMFYHHFIECIFHFNGYHKHRGTTGTCRLHHSTLAVVDKVRQS